MVLVKLKPEMFSETSFERKANELIDLITIRIKDKSVEEVAEGLLKSMFDLRFDLTKWLSRHDQPLDHDLSTFGESIATNLQLAPYSRLSETLVQVLSTVSDISTPTLQSSGEDLIAFVAKSQPINPGYDFLDFLMLFPSPQVQYLKHLVDASLRLNVASILADLILTKQIHLSSERVDLELIPFLRQTLTRFGAYAIFTGVWSPLPEDASDVTNRMKILAATIELDHHSFETTTKEGLFDMINR